MGQVTRPPTVEGYVAELEQRIANLERRQAAAVVAPEGISAKVSNGVAVRTEGATVQFVGVLSGTAELPSGTVLFTLPVGFRPPFLLRIDTPNISKVTLNLCLIESDGKVTLAVTALVGEFISFDGKFFALR